jgi:hypothetical protein
VIIQYDEPWAALQRVPRHYGIFLEIPQWFTKDEKIVCLVGWFLAILLTACCSRKLVKLWRYLVTKKYRWMSEKEADEYLARDPGW